MAKRLSRYVEALRLGAVIDGKAPAGGTAAGQFLYVPMYETIQINTAVSATMFVNDTASGTYVIAAVSDSFGTTSTSGTVQVEVATGTQALGSGTNQLTTPVSLSGTANTTLNGVVIVPPTQIVAGSRVNVILSGTLTGLANNCINVVLQRVA